MHTTRAQVFTIIAAGSVSAALFALVVYAPSKPELYDLSASRSAMLANTNATLTQLSGVAASTNNATLAAQVAEQQQALAALGNPSKTWIPNQPIIDVFQSTQALQAGVMGV
jgi:hypothetical protein